MDDKNGEIREREGQGEFNLGPSEAQGIGRKVENVIKKSEVGTVEQRANVKNMLEGNEKAAEIMGAVADEALNKVAPEFMNGVIDGIPGGVKLSDESGEGEGEISAE